MEISVCVALESGTAASGTVVDGRCLFTALDELDGIATTAGVRCLSSFMWADPAELGVAEDIDSDPADPTAAAMYKEPWFDPAEGLHSVETVLEYLNQDPDREWQEDLIADLEGVQRILAAAAGSGTRFHLSIV